MFITKLKTYIYSLKNGNLNGYQLFCKEQASLDGELRFII